MNPLEPLISILKIKPVVSEHSQVNVLIKGEFLDERENEFDIETLMKKLADAKLTTVIIKPTSVREEEVLQEPEPEPALTTKKIIGKKGNNDIRKYILLSFTCYIINLFIVLKIFVKF